MDWNGLVLGLVSLIAAIDLGKIFFPGIFKREKQADIQGKEKDNESVEVETLKKTIETLSGQLDNAYKKIDDYEIRNRALSDENGELKATVTALYDDMCVHKGCRVRKPHQGQGQQWYLKYREDPALGADYMSIETLLRQDRLKRLAREKELESGNDNGNNQ